MLRFRIDEPTKFALRVKRASDGSGFPGLFPTLAVTDPTGDALALAPNVYGEWAPAIVAGLYLVEVPSTAYPDLGIHLGQASPGDPDAVEPPPFAFERVGSLVVVGLGRGRPAFDVEQDVEFSIRIVRASDLQPMTGLAPTMRVGRETGAEVALASAALTERSATNAAGVYDASIPAGAMDAAGAGAEMMFADVDPNDGAAQALDPYVFERVDLAAAPAPAPPAPGSLAELIARRDALVRRRESLRTKIAAGDKSVDYDLGMVGEALNELDRLIGTAGGAVPTRQVRTFGRKGL